jgi:hypothetical protein
MPPGNQWSADEVTIAVYFSSRQICCKAVRFLLLRRGYDRSVPAIERKLLSISQQHPDLRTSEGNWELNVADSWIDAVLGDHESVNQLIRFSLADAEDVILYVSDSGYYGLILRSRLCSPKAESTNL